MAGMAVMAEREKEWQNSRMAEMATYVLFMVHTNDDTDNDRRHLLILYIIRLNGGIAELRNCGMAEW